MKTTRKLLSLTLALMLVLAMALPAFAVDATITITNGNDKAAYSAYRLLNLTTSDVAASTELNYAYTLNAKYEDILKGVSGKTTQDEIIAYIGEQDTAQEARAFAEAVFAAIEAANPAIAADETAADAKFTGVAQGYYLIVETSTPGEGEVASLVMLDTAGKTAIEVTSKSDAMAVDKKVNGKDAYETYSIGDTVPFTITASLPHDLDQYSAYTCTFHDTMSAGLTYKADSMTVKVGGATLAATDYDLTVNGTAITIDLSTYITANKATLSEKAVEIAYDATLNTSAVVNNAGNPNEVYLTFSNNPNKATTGNTAVDTVKVYTYEAQVVKYTDDNTQIAGFDAADTRLAGAKFVITRATGESGAQVTEYAIADDGYTITGWTATQADATTFVSNATGDISVKGLDAGSYKLVETEAPEGFNKLGAPVSFTITQVNGQADIPVTYVENTSGALLPSTGGIGTTVFYVVGGLLMTCAAVLLVAKKKMSKEH